MQKEMLIDRFGKEGWLAWNLAQGLDDRPLLPLKQEEVIVEHTALPFCSVSLELLLAAVDTLLRRAYAQPRMRGRYASGVALQCVLQRAVPWEKDFHFKRGVGDWAGASRILRGQLEADHPRAPVAELTLAPFRPHRGIGIAVGPSSGRSGRTGSCGWPRRSGSCRPGCRAGRRCTGWSRWPPGIRRRSCGRCRCPLTPGERAA